MRLRVLWSLWDYRKPQCIPSSGPFHPRDALLRPAAGAARAWAMSWAAKVRMPGFGIRFCMGFYRGFMFQDTGPWASDL